MHGTSILTILAATPVPLDEGQVMIVIIGCTVKTYVHHSTVAGFHHCNVYHSNMAPGKALHPGWSLCNSSLEECTLKLLGSKSPHQAIPFSSTVSFWFLT